MSTQIPLILSDDANLVVLRVKHTWASQRLGLSELQGCWRPPGPRSGKPQWTDKRLAKAIEEAEASGLITRREGICGDVLELTK
jgi:hypothetical protein